MTAQASPRVIIGASNLNLPLKDMVRGDEEAYSDFLFLGHFDWEAGFEWTPVRFPAAQRAAESLAEQGLVSAVHESWREGRLRDIARQRSLGGLVTEAGVVAAFPLLDKSYDRLGRISRAAGGGLPMLVHPEGQCLDNKLPRRLRWNSMADKAPFGRVLFQPTAEWALARGLNPGSPNVYKQADEIDEARQEDGLDGTVLDFNHLLAERMGVRFRDPVGLAGALAAKASMHEVQLSLRPDFGADPEEVRWVLQGYLEHTVFGRMLAAVHSSAPAGTVHVVSEVQASSIKTLLGKEESLGDVHTRVNNSVRELMAA